MLDTNIAIPYLPLLMASKMEFVGKKAAGTAGADVAFLLCLFLLCVSLTCALKTTEYLYTLEVFSVEIIRSERIVLLLISCVYRFTGSNRSS